MSSRDPRPFRAYGPGHLAVLAVVVFGSVLLCWLAARIEPPAPVWIGRVLGLLLASTVLTWTLAEARARRLDPARDLPLDLCNALALAAPVVAWNPSVALHEVYYYLVMTGTVQAILTPDLAQDFPHRNFLKYWIVHGGLVVSAVYGVFGLGLTPTWPGVGKAFVVTLAYSASMYLINRMLGANYCYLVAKPSQPTLLDLFGPWPWYVLIALGVGLAMFIGFWLLATSLGHWGGP